MDLFGNFQCTCAGGYAGVHCEQYDALDDCHPATGDPCHAQGTCTDVFISFQCACFTGYGGADCTVVESQQQDPCLSQPCMNMGNCIHQFSGSDYTYTCQCQANFQGAQCENAMGAVGSQCGVECCQAGGLCQHGTSVFGSAAPDVCQCRPNYSGLACNQQNLFGQRRPVAGCQTGTTPGGAGGMCPPGRPACTPADVFTAHCSASVTTTCCCA